MQDSGLQDDEENDQGHDDVEMDDLRSNKSDPDYELDNDITAFRNYDYLAQLVEVQMRYGYSDNSVANLINSYLRCKGIEDPSQYLSPGKLRNCRGQHVFDLMEQHKDKSGFKVIGTCYFHSQKN